MGDKSVSTESHDQVYLPVVIDTEEAQAIMAEYDTQAENYADADDVVHRMADLIDDLLNQIPSKQLLGREDDS
jgi:hypothetical protein